jgi:type IV pilus assembly protein PilZ
MAPKPNPDAIEPSGATRPTVLSLAVREKAALFAAYMPSLKNGGIFIPTEKRFQLGEEIYLILTLMDEPTKFPIAGRVAWISFPGSTSRQPGIGVHFPADEAGKAARKRIEELLGGAVRSPRPTHTI